MAKNGRIKGFVADGTILIEKAPFESFKEVQAQRKELFQVHSYDVRLALKYSVTEATFLQHMAYFIHLNREKGAGIANGITWSFCSVAKLHSKYFPEYSEDTIQRALSRLEKQKVLLIGNFNKHKYDKTNWYTIIDPDIREFYGLGSIEAFRVDGVKSGLLDDFLGRKQEEKANTFSGDLRNDRRNLRQPIQSINKSKKDRYTYVYQSKENNDKSLFKQTPIGMGEESASPPFHPSANETDVAVAIAPAPLSTTVSYGRREEFQGGNNEMFVVGKKAIHSPEENKISSQSSAPRPTASNTTKLVRVSAEERIWLPVIEHWNAVATTMREDKANGLCMAPRTMSVHKLDNSGYVSKTIKKAISTLSQIHQRGFKTVLPNSRMYSNGTINEKFVHYKLEPKNVIKLITEYAKAFYPKIFPVDKNSLQPSITGFIYEGLANPKSEYATRSWLWHMMNDGATAVSTPSREKFDVFEQFYPEVMKKIADNMEYNRSEIRSKVDSYIAGIIEDWTEFRSRGQMLYKDWGPKELQKIYNSPGYFVSLFIDFVTDKWDLRPGHFYVDGATYKAFKEHLKSKFNDPQCQLLYNPAQVARERIAYRRWVALGAPEQVVVPGVKESFCSKEDIEYLKENKQIKAWWDN